MCLSFSGHKHPCVKHHLHGHLSAIKYLKLFVPHCAFAWSLFNNIPLMDIETKASGGTVKGFKTVPCHL